MLEDAAEGRFEILAKAASFWAGECLLKVLAASLGRPIDLPQVL